MAYPFSDLLKPLKTAFSGMVSPAFPTKPIPLTSTTTPPATSAINNSMPKPAIPNLPASTPIAPSTPPVPATNNNSYTVASGDTLSAIASKNNISLTQLLNLNPQFRANPNLIKPGQSTQANYHATGRDHNHTIRHNRKSCNWRYNPATRNA